MAAMSAVPAYAQDDSASAQSSGIGDIVVTAQRRTQNV
jgi:outer membrane cobalamin receptor